MKKIKWYYHGMTKEDKRSGIEEMPDGFTNKEIEEEVWGIVREFFEWGWWKLRPEESGGEGEAKMRAIFEIEMELPETCRACEKAIKIQTPCQKPDGFFNKVCGLTGNNVNRYDNERDLACPLKIVPNESEAKANGRGR